MSGQGGITLISEQAQELMKPPPPSRWEETWRECGEEFEELAKIAREHNCYVRGIVDSHRKAGIYSAILLVWEMSSSSEFHFTTGFFKNLDDAIDFTTLIFSDEEFEMNLLKSTKLFPNYRGVMLKEKRIKLIMSGKVNITEMRDGADARVEIYFSNSDKTAVINRTQALKLIDLYGGETDNWKGKPCVIYGEYGTWFGKSTWGIRVDLEQSKAANQHMQASVKHQNDEEE